MIRVERMITKVPWPSGYPGNSKSAELDSALLIYPSEIHGSSERNKGGAIFIG
jgi:hypothetical protein